MLRLWSSQRK